MKTPAAIYVVTGILVFLALASCEDEPRTIIYSGKVVLGCDQLPFSTGGLVLDQNGQFFAQTTTDALGSFSFQFSTDEIDESEGINFGILTQQGTRRVIQELNLAQTGDLGTFVIDATHNIVVSLNALNAYTGQDTLYYTDYSDPTKSQMAKRAGPFQSVAIDTFNNVLFQESIGFVWYVNENTFETNNNAFFPVNSCETNAVTLDIQ